MIFQNRSWNLADKFTASDECLISFLHMIDSKQEKQLAGN